MGDRWAIEVSYPEIPDNSAPARSDPQKCYLIHVDGFSGGNHPPPKPQIPTLIGWDFFARSPCVGAVSGRFPLSMALWKSLFPADFSPIFTLCSLLPA